MFPSDMFLKPSSVFYADYGILRKNRKTKPSVVWYEVNNITYYLSHSGIDAGIISKTV